MAEANGLFASLLEALHSAEDGKHREAYAGLLALGRAAVPDLVAAFPGTRGRARLSVIRLLGDLGDARAVRLLVTLARSRDAQEYLFVSSLAVRALGHIGGQAGPAAEQAVAALVEMLEDRGSTGTRRMAALVLGTLTDPGAVPALTAALADDDRDVRALAARSLGQIGAERAVPALIVRLHDHDPLPRPLDVGEGRAGTVSDAAAWALAQINTDEAQRALQNHRSGGTLR